jgi:hypothetical protein
VYFILTEAAGASLWRFGFSMHQQLLDAAKAGADQVAQEWVCVQ